MPDDHAPKPPTLSYAGPATNTEPRWETLRMCQNAFEANLAVARLTDAGLQARVDGENLSGLQHWGVSGVGGTRVQVLASDLEAAQKLLAEVDSAASRRRESAIVRCPRCNTPAKRAWHPIRKLGLILLIAPLVIGWSLLAMSVNVPTIAYVPMPIGVMLLVWTVIPRWRCPQCGNQWAQPEPEEPDETESIEEAQEI